MIDKFFANCHRSVIVIVPEPRPRSSMQLPPTNALIQALSRLAPEPQPRYRPGAGAPLPAPGGAPVGEPVGPVLRTSESGQRHLPRGSLVDITV